MNTQQDNGAERELQGVLRAASFDAEVARRQFQEQGYTVIRGFYSAHEMDALIHDIRTADPKDSRPDVLNHGEMRFYSNIFFRSKPLQEQISDQKLLDIVCPIAGPDLWVRWDQAVAKGPGSGDFPWHQDNAYNFLKVEHFQLWIALSEITPERGGLWVVPGSHLGGVLPHAAVGNHQAYRGPTDGAVSLKAEAGDLVLFSSKLLHYTSPNVTDIDRWAYVVEYMHTAHFDPFIKGPFFMVSKDGRSAPEFKHLYRGRLSPSQQMLYAVPHAQNRKEHAGEHETTPVEGQHPTLTTSSRHQIHALARWGLSDG